MAGRSLVGSVPNDSRNNLVSRRNRSKRQPQLVSSSKRHQGRLQRPNRKRHKGQPKQLASNSKPHQERLQQLNHRQHKQ
jgi:hypothetical protein